MSRRSTVLITGGSVGYGLAMAKKFTSEGYKVFVCGRREVELGEAVEAVEGLIPIRADVTVAADRERLWQVIAEHGDTLDILVNNAAISQAHDFTHDVDLESDRSRIEIEVNLAAPIELVRLYLRDRRSTGREASPGVIVNIGTPGALFPLDANPIYSATKAGFHMYTMALRTQLKDTAVRVVEVFPPGLPTELAPDLIGVYRGDVESLVEVVGAQTVVDILAGVDIVLPHEQSRELYAAVPHLDPDFVARINAGVKRQPDWDKR